MRIREERPEDLDEISTLITTAFDDIGHSSHNEAAITNALRTNGVLAVSLLAIEGGKVVGHVAFSPVRIAGGDCSWYGLGPVSVLPSRQRRGFGSSLIREGLARLEQMGAGGCVVLGDPGYYRRFGFQNDPRLYFAGAPARYFQQLHLSGAMPTGAVAYDPAFGVA